MSLAISVDMPRTARPPTEGVIQHVVNRGNYRRVLFPDDSHYQWFVTLLQIARSRFPVRLLAYCLMPNHFHLVLWPLERRALAAYMHWVTTSHVRRHHRVQDEDGLGHLYQDRYRNVAIGTEIQLLVLLKYVESNPVRAGLVSRAENWPWSSLGHYIGNPSCCPIDESPVPRLPNWLDFVNE
ncbi:MAG TPA: transposase [Vicinamibacterales bacterium]